MPAHRSHPAAPGSWVPLSRKTPQESPFSAFSPKGEDALVRNAAPRVYGKSVWEIYHATLATVSQLAVHGWRVNFPSSEYLLRPSNPLPGCTGPLFLEQALREVASIIGASPMTPQHHCMTSNSQFLPLFRGLLWPQLSHLQHRERTHVPSFPLLQQLSRVSGQRPSSCGLG